MRTPRRGTLAVDYAVFLFGRQVTPWASHTDAIKDAIAAGFATRDPGEPPYFWAGASLERRRD